MIGLYNSRYMQTSTSNPDSPRIAALVLNSVNHDARVLKEADTLAEAGFDVHIIGIQDKRCPDPLTKRSPGVTIHRVSLSVNLMVRIYQNRAQNAMIGMVAMCMLAAGVVFTPLRSLFQSLGNSIMDIGIFPIIAAGCCLAIAGKMFLRYRKFQKAAIIKAREDGAATPIRKSKPASYTIARRILSAIKSLVTAWKQFLKYRVVSSLYRNQLDQIAPQAVHCHDLPMLPIGTKWCKANPHAKLVFDSHELYEEVSQMSSMMRRIWQRVLRRNASKVNAFITVNDSIAGEHAKRYPALPPAVVIKNATIVDGKPLVRTNLIHDAADLNTGDRVLLYQGGFAPHRGLESLIESAAQMPEPWVLVMMGWGNIESNLKDLANKVDPHGKRIRFIPPAPHAELKSWTSGGDLGVIPYENTCLNHWYCSPNKLWEYPIAGVPMLVSPFPELKGVIDKHGVGACLPEKLDGAGLSKVLSDIDEDRLENMRDACATYIAKDNWAVYAERLIEIYVSQFSFKPMIRETRSHENNQSVTA